MPCNPTVTERGGLLGSSAYVDAAAERCVRRASLPSVHAL